VITFAALDEKLPDLEADSGFDASSEVVVRVWVEDQTKLRATKEYI
jgi:hypothetical protein